ncbi:MAG: TetR/AcrR family transcriptional regulator [Solirubrobacteraceae bacterium]|nr:TetR/AcrR family transcriptional regulator [Solirubrobacteraceae bacterium]
MSLSLISTEDRILDAALEEFLLIGFRRATVGSVAQRAGVGPATIYRRVGQREQLVGATIARETQRCLAEIAEAVEPYDALDDRIAETFVAVLRVFVGHPLMVRLRELEPESLALQLADADALLDLGRAWIRAEIDRAMALGQTAVADPGALADVLVRFTHSVLVTPPAELVADETRARAYARATIAPLVR